MAVNRFGARLDRNKYAPSLLAIGEAKCFNCGTVTNTERHEVFGGALRDKSKELGLWVPLCGECHRTGKLAVHQCEKSATFLKQIAQRKAMNDYGWDMEEWMKNFYKNYLEENDV